jgi:hypothetical protein
MQGTLLCPDRNGVGQQQASAVGRVTGPVRHPGQKRHDSRLYGILKEDGTIKPALAKHGNETQKTRHSSMLALFIEDHDFITVGMAGEQLGHQRIRNHGDMGLWERLSHRPESRSRHDGITYPVGCSHQDTLRILSGQIFQI